MKTGRHDTPVRTTRSSAAWPGRAVLRALRSTGDAMSVAAMSLALLGSTACHSSRQCDPVLNQDVTLCDADTVACRPYELRVPQNADQPLELLVSLHGYGGNGASNLEHLSLQNVAEERGWLLASPTGTHDESGCNTWNVAGYGSGRDDRAYLDAVIADVEGHYEVSRVMVLGYSMGGSFAFKYACDRPLAVEAVASLAGRVSRNLECPTPAARTLLAIGDDDQGFPGASDDDFYPPSGSINHMALANDCSSGPVLTGRERVLVVSEASAVEVWDYGGCTVETELWTQPGVGHSLGGGKPGAVNSSDVLSFLEGSPEQ